MYRKVSSFRRNFNEVSATSEVLTSLPCHFLSPLLVSSSSSPLVTVPRHSNFQIHLFDVALTGGASSAGPNGDAPVSNGSVTAGPPKKGGESSRIRPGMRINTPVQTEIGKIGLEICYDIR